MINGTWGMQMGLLVACLFNYATYPVVDVPISPDISVAQYDYEMQQLRIIREFYIPISHFGLMVFTFISASDRIPWEGLKQSFNFMAMITYTLMILNASVAMNYYHYPLQSGQVNSLAMQASYLWLVIEQLVFISLLLSNMTYISLRTCLHHKLNLD